MTDTPEPPKLFISYSWTSPQHQQWVLELAEKLVNSSVDVKLDIWDLKEGHDKIVFMEQMVTDPDIRKVLMIIDKNYAEKADAREGGVGTETQIISKEIYEKQGQDKFVALVRDKDEAGQVYLPTYYKSKIYIDFSELGNHEKEFERLLRWIFDKPLHVKPPLGKPPVFLSDESRIDIATTVLFRRAIEAIKDDKGNASGHVEDYLETLSSGLEEFRVNVAEIEGLFDDAVIASIENFIPYRAEFIELLLTIVKYSEVGNCAKILHKFFEGLIPYLYTPEGLSPSSGDMRLDNFKFIIHELFLYTIAILLRSEKFEVVHYLIFNDYYSEYNARSGGDLMVPYKKFYNFVEAIRARNERSERRRISLHADIIAERAQDSGVDFKHIMQADFVLFMKEQMDGVEWSNRWYPVTLPYTFWSYGGVFEIFARAESVKYFDRIKLLFGIDKKDDMNPLFKAYATDPDLLPLWEGSRLHPQSLMGFDKLATKP